MISHITLLLFLLLAAFSSSAAQPALSQAELSQLGFAQHLDQKIPLELEFRDESVRSIRLGEFFGSQPVILVLGYYRCPMLCDIVLNSLIESLQDIRKNVGSDFSVVNVSIDPKETAIAARSNRQKCIQRYGRSGSERGWHFLTGRQTNIQKLADAVGFQYRFDPVTQEYAHPSGFAVLTPDGRISSYLFGVKYSAKELDEALHAASARKIRSPVQQLLLLCFQHSPLTGKYSHTILQVLRYSSVVMVLGIGVLIITMTRREARGKETDPSLEGGGS